MKTEIEKSNRCRYKVRFVIENWQSGIDLIYEKYAIDFGCMWVAMCSAPLTERSQYDDQRNAMEMKLVQFANVAFSGMLLAKVVM